MDEQNPKKGDGRKNNLPNGGKGRPKGAVNKATKTFRETVSNLLEGNAQYVQEWLHTVAYGDIENGVKPDPKGALDLLSKLAEYATPKLARTEVVGDKENPLAHSIEFTIVDPKEK